MEEIVLELAKKHDGGTIALFSHGAAIRALVCRIKGMPSNEVSSIPHCDNAAIAVMNVDTESDKIELISYGDNSHLVEDNCTNFGRQAWWKTKDSQDSSNIRYVEMDLDDPDDREIYLSACRDMCSIDGEEGEFSEEECLESGKKHIEKNPASLVKALADKTLVGVMELDTEKGETENRGFIKLYYMFPKYRGQFLGIQLLGHATAVYRNMGREYLAIEVKNSNENAIGFFQHFGFMKTEENEKTTVLEKYNKVW